MFLISRRSVLLATAARPFGVLAQEPPWPSGPVKIVVPYPPGGSTDAIARLVQPELQRRLGATIFIENRPGASGSIGTAGVVKAPADGNTWLMVFDNHAANPFVLPPLPYDTIKDLDPVLLIGTAPYVISTQAGKPYRSLGDVIAAAKARPDGISYASVGSGSVGHLAMTVLSEQAAIRLVHVPYRGGGPAMNDAIAGHVELLVGSTALSVPQLTAGAIRALAQTGKARTNALDDVPTVGESGFPGFEAYAWWGVFAPIGVSTATAVRFAEALTACLRTPRVTAQLEETQQVTLALGGREQLRSFLAGQMRVWGAVAREHAIKAE